MIKKHLLASTTDSIKKSVINPIAYLTSSLLIVSCGQASFSDSTKNRKKRNSDVDTLRSAETIKTAQQSENSFPSKSKPIQSILVSCDEWKNGSNISVDLNPSSSLVKIGGQYCLPLSESVEMNEKISIIFVLDKSGSMNENDPLIDGSCGRYQAAVNLTEQIKTKSTDVSTSSITTVGFAESAQVIDSFQPAIDFMPSVSSFCESRDEGTNYDTAFSTIQSFLKDRTENNIIVYFISDGFPTQSGWPLSTIGPPSTRKQLARDEGIKSALELREQFPNLTLNALYLSGESDSRSSAKTYLTKVTGDAGRVKIVESALDLAEEILKLPSAPIPSTIELTAELWVRPSDADAFQVSLSTWTRIFHEYLF